MTNRYYCHYFKWEDWKGGMYKGTQTRLKKVNEARELLSSPDALIAAMRYVLENWHHSAKQNMTDDTSNKRAWLGQAACCFECGATEAETRQAWGEIEPTERIDANLCADIAISEWNYRNGVGDYLYACVIRDGCVVSC